MEFSEANITMKDKTEFWATLIIASVYNAVDDTFFSITWLIFAIVILLMSLRDY